MTIEPMSNRSSTLSAMARARSTSLFVPERGARKHNLKKDKRSDLISHKPGKKIFMKQ